MKKYIIHWTVGYGNINSDVVEAESMEAAAKMAHERWYEDVVDGAEYYAKEWDDDEAYNLSLMTSEEKAEYEARL